MKVFSFVLSVLVVISLGFNVVNLKKINSKISLIKQKIPTYDVWWDVCAQRDNYIHKLFAKEPLRKYTYVLNRPEYKGDMKNPYPNKIWIYWSEGFDNAPKITPACIDSIRKHIPNMEIILLDKHNFKKYIKLPEHILKKYESGIISETHMSDIIRCYLLRDYGGLWIDATVYMSGNLPDDILKADFFAPSVIDVNPNRSKQFKFNDLVIHAAFASHFMYSKQAHNYIFECLTAFFNEYWKDKEWYDYYILYEFTAVAMEEDQRFCDIVMNMLRNCYYPESKFLKINQKIQAKYTKKGWTEIKQFPIHKICQASRFFGDIKKGTFAEKLINGELK